MKCLYYNIYNITVADPELPRFAEEIQNVTVSVGRDALLACVVDNLRNYKVKHLVYGIRFIFFPLILIHL